MRGGVLTVLLILAAAAVATSAGCTDTGPGYSVSDDGILSYETTAPSFDIEQLEQDANFSAWSVVIHDDISGEDIYAVLASPADPSAAVVFSPGAGVTAEDHLSRAEEYAENGIAFMAVDTRGNGGPTAGYPLSQQSLAKDYRLYDGGEWPQYYLIIRDLSEAKAVIRDRYGDLPVYSMGSSNGGRYAAIAAAADTDFAGYIGVSTSAFGFEEGGESYDEDTLRFLRSIDPATCIGRISPRPVYIFHAEEDPIIPFSMGQAFYEEAGEPKTFIPFNGTHGVNGEVDGYLIGNLLKT